jgi:hypothetical protein
MKMSAARSNAYAAHDCMIELLLKNELKDTGQKNESKKARE